MVRRKKFVDLIEMDHINPVFTQTIGDGNCECFKKSRPESCGIKSTTLCNKLNDPQDVNHCDNSSLMEFKRHVGRYVYASGLQFSSVNLPCFRELISLGSSLMHQRVPTPTELKGWILEEEVKEMRAYENEIRYSWTKTGCSILLDEWTSSSGRNFVNVLVDCAKGTIYLQSHDISDFCGNIDAMLSFLGSVLLEVGVDNVVQIITNSTSTFMKEVGKHLMEKYKSIFWSVSASCCIELMLEIIGEMDFIRETLEKAKIITTFLNSSYNVLTLLHEWTDGHDIVKPSIITSIQPFTNLENVVLEKESLKMMFLASDSKTSLLTSTIDGKRVAELLEDRLFWSGAMKTLKATIPLVRVSELMYDNNGVKVGYIYDTIDQAKETIREEFQNRKSLYMPIWKVIDDVWNQHLYSPLHSAGYFLNPNLFYSSDVYIDPEVATGLCCCLVRSARDLKLQDLIMMQIEDYRKAKNAFGVGCSADGRSNISPAQWWTEYGRDYPELQKFAIRILSQACDGGSKFPLKMSMVEELFAGVKQTESQNLTDLVYLNYNMHIKNFTAGKTDYITSGVESWRRN